MKTVEKKTLTFSILIENIIKGISANQEKNANYFIEYKPNLIDGIIEIEWFLRNNIELLEKTKNTSIENITTNSDSNSDSDFSNEENEDENEINTSLNNIFLDNN